MARECLAAATSCFRARYRHLLADMRAFAELLDRLYFTHSNLAKAALLHDYFRRTPDESVTPRELPPLHDVIAEFRSRTGTRSFNIWTPG